MGMKIQSFSERHLLADHIQTCCLANGMYPNAHNVITMLGILGYEIITPKSEDKTNELPASCKNENQE